MRKLIATFILLCPLLALGQTTRQIKGQILDRVDGTPIIGATVFIDPSETGAKDYNPQGTVADVNGHFVFTLPTSVKFVAVSSLGYETMKVEITPGKDMVIRLAPQTQMVDEVVVTGYQKIEKRKLTSSIAKIDMETINRVGVASVDQMLEGQLAGVYTSPTSGAPGAPAKTRVRSSVTLNGTDEPLWVLDGMPLESNQIPKDWNSSENIDDLSKMNSSIAGINPDDIADITVLKDAAATAIYGARAANGVIIVTTKKGTRGEKTKISASLATFITAKPNFDKLNLMNANEKVDFELQLARNPKYDYLSEMGAVARILDANGGTDRNNLINGAPLSAAGLAAIDNLRNSGANWADEIYRMTINQQYGLSVSGGGEKASYYFSTGYFNEQGTTKNTGFDRFNLTIKTDYDILKNLRFGVAMFGTISNNKSYITDQNSFTNASRYTRSVNPYVDAYDANGNYVYDPDMVANPRGDSRVLDFNFLEESYNTEYKLKNQSFKSIFDLDYKPIKGLKLYTQLGLQLDNSAMEKMGDKASYFVRKYAVDSEINNVPYLPEGGVIINTNEDFFQYDWKAQAEFQKQFAGGHEFDVMAGMEMRGNTQKTIGTKGFGYDPKTLQTKPLIFPDDKPGSSATADKLKNDKFKQYTNLFNENRFLSYFMTASYTYDNRFTAFGSLRYDGSNLFGVDPKYKFTPLWSISGAWNVNREQWMKGADWLNNLKLRASYGVQGNIDRSTSPFVKGRWNNTYLVDNTYYEPVIDVSSLPNRYLRWETTNTWNAAIDMSVLDNRLSMTAEAYGRSSDDLITVEFLPQENGFGATMSNYGKMSSKGFELSISSVNISGKSFRWTTDFNIAHSKTRVDRINVDKSSPIPSLKGYSPNAVFGFKTAGLDENGIPMFVQGDKVVSFSEFFEANYKFVPGNWVMETEDAYYINSASTNDDVRERLTYLGDRDPKFTGGLINRLFYKNFDLSISANFALGQLVTVTPWYNPARTSPGVNYSREMNNVWSPTNTGGKYPAIAEGYIDRTVAPTAMDYYNVLMDAYTVNIFNNLDIWTKKMNYLRINSIRLGYTLPNSLTKKLHISSARLSFEARNPFVIATNYDGYFDPENYGNIYAQPLARTFSIGLNLSF